ncbi:unnamed protein product [Calypogeia fissa]
MGEALPLSKRPGDALLALFFFLHLPIMILIDGQTVFPKDWYPAFLKDVVRFHITTNGDYLVRDLPPFFMGLIFCEFAIQLPLHAACGYAFVTGKKWGRMAGIIYGVHTATTLVPILADILASQEPTRFTLLAIYLPYLVIPLIVVARLLPYTDPFAAPVKFSVEKKRQ